MGVLVRELAALYDAFAQGRPRRCPSCRSSTPTSPSGSGEWLAGRGAGGAARLLAASAWPARRPCSSCPPTGRGRRCRASAARRRACALPAELSAAARGAWPARRGRPSFMVLLAGFEALLAPLHRAGRPASSARRSPTATGAEIEGLIGFFVNTLVAARRPRRATRRFARAARAGRARRPSAPTPTRTCRSRSWSRSCSRSASLAHTPLFQVMLRSRTRPREPLRAAGPRASRRSEAGARHGQVRPDADLWTRTDGGCRRPLEYNTDLFDARHRRPAARPLRDAARREPRRTRTAASRELPLLAAAERQQLAAMERARGRAVRRRRCLHRAASRRRPRARPEAVAVVCEGERLTYGELDRRRQPPGPPPARPRACGPEALVGLCLERSLGLVVGDPRHPQGRRRLRAARSGLPGGAPRLHARGRGAARARSTGELRPGCRRPRLVWTPSAAIGAESARRPRSRRSTWPTSSTPRARPAGPRAWSSPTPTSPACSRPPDAWFGFGPDDVWTLFHSFAFDFSVWEIWGALLYGGRLVVVPYWVSRSPEAFYELLARRAGDGAQPDPVGLPPAHPGRGGGRRRARPLACAR